MPPPALISNNVPIKNVERFTYLGSVLNARGNADDDVQRRIALASAAFGRLSQRVFLNKDLRSATKVAVYRSVCLSILLYTSECWIVYRRHLRCIERFHTQCLQRILGLRWWHMVPHVDIRRRAGIDSIETIIVERHLRWAGHVRRMPENRLPRRIYYGELAGGRRHVGGPKKRHKDNLAAWLRAGNVDPGSFEQLSGDRQTWKTTCIEAIATHTDKNSRAAEERRARRHREPAPADQHYHYQCGTCGRICQSRIGLFSHEKMHRGGRGE